MACSEAEDAGGLAPAKDDNEAARFFIRRTLPILDCVDYKSGLDGLQADKQWVIKTAYPLYADRQKITFPPDEK